MIKKIYEYFLSLFVSSEAIYHKIGRNDMCHCGSGIKYKKCCLEKDRLLKEQEAEQIQNAKINDQYPVGSLQETARRGLASADEFFKKNK